MNSNLITRSETSIHRGGTMVNSILLRAVKLDICCERCNTLIHSRPLLEYLQINYNITLCPACGIGSHAIGAMWNMTEEVCRYITAREINGETLHQRLNKYITCNILDNNLTRVANYVYSHNIPPVSSDSIYCEALDNDPSLIRTIENPSWLLQMYIVSQNIENIQYIKSPHKEVIQYVETKKIKNLTKIFQDIEQW